MAYLGSTPTTSSQSLVKQDFSVSATQNYTLSQSVTSANDIALYINNVRQEPTYAYSASGTSLTLTEATAGSDDMYCVYIGRAVGTINPASGSVGMAQLSATGTKSSSTFLRGDNSFAEAGGGKILQVVNVHNNDYTTYSSTNVDNKAQVFTASITPSATTSKILITGFISVSSSYSSVKGYGVDILRGSTVIGTGDASSLSSNVGSAHSFIARGDTSSYSQPDRALPLHFLDTPNTTSATTYNFNAYAHHYGSSLSSITLVVNGGGYNYNNKETAVTTSNIILMEIGA
tara:strand:+ start:2403 stop:3269 length:867 start_codon:yes stop_codon:yes gene_type:complete